MLDFRSMREQPDTQLDEQADDSVTLEIQDIKLGHEAEVELGEKCSQ
jgi:hypothetical protein